MLIKKVTRLIPLILTLLFMFGCNEKVNSTDDALSILETEVFYNQSGELPDGAVLDIRLEDVSKMDVASELISTTSRPIKGTPPYAMRITFPTHLIKMQHSYSLAASIKVDGKLHFISTTRINPFAVGLASPIKIKVEQVGG